MMIQTGGWADNSWSRLQQNFKTVISCYMLQYHYYCVPYGFFA